MRRTNILIDVSDDVYDVLVEPMKKNKTFSKLIASLIQGYLNDSYIRAYADDTLEDLRKASVSSFNRSIDSMAESLSNMGLAVDELEAVSYSGKHRFSEVAKHQREEISENKETKNSDVDTLNKRVDEMQASFNNTLQSILEMLRTNTQAPTTQYPMGYSIYGGMGGIPQGIMGGIPQGTMAGVPQNAIGGIPQGMIQGVPQGYMPMYGYSVNQVYSPQQGTNPNQQAPQVANMNNVGYNEGGVNTQGTNHGNMGYSEKINTNNTNSNSDRVLTSVEENKSASDNDNTTSIGGSGKKVETQKFDFEPLSVVKPKVSSPKTEAVKQEEGNYVNGILNPSLVGSIQEEVDTTSSDDDNWDSDADDFMSSMLSGNSYSF